MDFQHSACITVAARGLHMDHLTLEPTERIMKALWGLIFSHIYEYRFIHVYMYIDICVCEYQ